MPKSSRASRLRRALSVVGDERLPEIQIVDPDTVPMTDEQHAAAVHALAALFDTWRATGPGLPRAEPIDGGRRLAA